MCIVGILLLSAVGLGAEAQQPLIQYVHLTCFTSITDPRGILFLRNEYDAYGRVVRQTQADGGVWSFAYTLTSGVLTQTVVTDPRGNRTTSRFNPQGYLLAQTDALGQTTTHERQIGTNLLLSTTDALGQTATFTYDGMGNLTTITDPVSHSTSRAYDQVSRLTSQTDPRGKSTAFAYDALNRLTTITDALNGITRFSYDGNGNLLTVTDALNHVLTHEYEAMDRLSRRIDPAGQAETFTYDGNGNLLSTTDRKGQTSTFTYDSLNRRARATYADGAVATFTYDTAGRLVQADDTADPHRPIALAYDGLDRLVAETTGMGTVAYQYDVLGRRTQMQANDLNAVTYTYDGASRLRTIMQAPLNPVDIQYDALGRRTKLTLPNGVNTEYQYDTASRLTALIYRNATGLLGDLAYTYDAAGNRTGVGGSFARTLLPDPVVSATYDALNRQLTFADKAMTYDADGNLTSLSDGSGMTIFTWDARNRLNALAVPGATSAFLYDAFGRRATKTVSGSSTQYLYDGLDMAQQSDSLGLTSYLRSLSIDEALSFTNRDGTYYSIHDPLGSTLAVVDQAASVTGQYTYEPFGRTSSTNPAFPNAFQFTSRENEEVSGLYYYRARYYLTSLGRFLSEDPIGPIGGLNRYSYAANNPLRYIDPSGLIPGVPEIPDGLDGVPPDLIAVVYGEATRQNFAAKLAVANVVKNRVQDITYEFRRLNTYSQVIHQKNAFEAVGTERFNLAQQVLSWRKPRPLARSEVRRLAAAFYAAQAVYHNTIPDSTGGSLFFYSPIIPQPDYISEKLEAGKLEQVFPQGVNPNDFLFFRYTR